MMCDWRPSPQTAHPYHGAARARIQEVPSPVSWMRVIWELSRLRGKERAFVLCFLASVGTLFHARGPLARLPRKESQASAQIWRAQTPTQRQVDTVLLKASSKQTAERPIRARRNRSCYWPSSHLPFTKIRRTQCPTSWVPASFSIAVAAAASQPLVWRIRETCALPSLRNQRLPTSVVPKNGPIFTDSHTRMPCQCSSGATKLESLSQTVGH